MFEGLRHDQPFDLQSKFAGQDLQVIGYLLTALTMSLIRFLSGEQREFSCTLIKVHW